ncbi:hypothetical protein Hanom_Chr12g01150021 [Helianthus anomalus]
MCNDIFDEQFKAKAKKEALNKHCAFIAEIKEKTREDILKEKTYRERCIVGYRIEEMEKEYEEARSNKIWDKKRECYVNRNGEPVVHPKQVVFDEVLAVTLYPASNTQMLKKINTIRKSWIKSSEML